VPRTAKGGDSERVKQLLSRMTGKVEERADLGDRHLLWAGGDLDDLVPRLHLALLEHPEVEPRPPVRREQGWNARLVHPDPGAVAGHTGFA
jgi:hypothetical protein